MLGMLSTDAAAFKVFLFLYLYLSFSFSISLSLSPSLSLFLSLCIFFSLCLSLSLSFTHTHTYTYADWPIHWSIVCRMQSMDQWIGQSIHKWIHKSIHHTHPVYPSIHHVLSILILFLSFFLCVKLQVDRHKDTMTAGRHACNAVKSIGR